MAKQAFLYQFVQDEEMQKLYEKGYNWVVESDHVEANDAMLTSLADMAIQYAQYGLVPFAQAEVLKIKSKKEEMLRKQPDSQSLKTQVADADKALNRLAEAGSK